MFNSKFLFVGLLFLLILSPGFLSSQSLGSGNNSTTRLSFSFTLKSGSLTSAGVYEEDGTLLRTLWSGKSYKAGTHRGSWDGLDDQGKV